jgi:hypothetical protein
MIYVLFDSESNMFLGPNGGFGPQQKSVQTARKYKRKQAAIEAASLHNVTRNLPAGRTPDHKYSNRPQVEVLELDDFFIVRNVWQAPPNYIYL